MSSSSAPAPGTLGAVHVGRQSVYDRALDIAGYELLFRSDAGAVTASERGSYATSQVIITAVTEIGLATLVGDRRCFVNLTREFLVGDLPLPFGPEQMVLEVLETLDIDDELVGGVAYLVEQGYVIALDDFVFKQGHERLLELASYVKIDVLDADWTDIATTVAACRRYPNVELVAERLETEEHLRLAMDLGFDYFQGYVLEHPQVVSATALPPPRLRRMELLGLLIGAHLPHSQIIALITSDAALSVRLLAAANADALGLPVKISSVHEAVMLLGVGRLRDWTALMLLSDLDTGHDQQDHAAAATARARMCQNLAKRMNVPGEPAFAVGLISAVAELLGQPAAELAPRLSLSNELTDALVRGTGPLGDLLTLMAAYEASDLPALLDEDADDHQA